MTKFVLDFIRRGLIGCGFGPLVLAILYGILEHQGLLETLPVRQVCMAIFSISALAFIAGGINAIYQLERLPLMVAILIHGAVLYGSYLVTYLLNDWLEWGPVPVMFFTGIFVVGYLAIWAVIYRVIRRNTARINEVLKRQQAHLE